MTENAGSVHDPCMFWYALKGGIRNITISFASHLNKVRLGKIELESKLKELENQQLSFCEIRKQNIQLTQIELDSLLRRRADFLIHKKMRNYYFNGPRPSHLLA